MRLLQSLIILTVLTVSCSPKQSESSKSRNLRSGLKQAMTFYAPFDGTADAMVAQGDPKIYSTKSRKTIDKAAPGLDQAPSVALAGGKGVVGDALSFAKKTSNIPYFKCKQNMPYSSQSWSGTVSFWLKLNPNKDLAPGFCDPIQITDMSYNDASLWVDFTRDDPRKFRLGVIGDLAFWDPDTIGPNDNPEYDKRLVVVNEPPFSRKQWTHIVIVYNQLNTEAGSGSLFVNGKFQGAVNQQSDPFSWDLSKANMFLGLNYVGLMDELAVFDRPLNEEEILEIGKVEGGLKAL